MNFKKDGFELKIKKKDNTVSLSSVFYNKDTNHYILVFSENRNKYKIYRLEKEKWKYINCEGIRHERIISNNVRLGSCDLIKVLLIDNKISLEYDELFFLQNFVFDLITDSKREVWLEFGTNIEIHGDEMYVNNTVHKMPRSLGYKMEDLEDIKELRIPIKI